MNCIQMKYNNEVGEAIWTLTKSNFDYHVFPVEKTLDKRIKLMKSQTTWMCSHERRTGKWKMSWKRNLQSIKKQEAQSEYWSNICSSNVAKTPALILSKTRHDKWWIFERVMVMVESMDYYNACVLAKLPCLLEYKSYGKHMESATETEMHARKQ